MFKRIFLALATVATLISVTGCAVGFTSEPVTKEIKTTASKYDANFASIVKGVSSIGAVTSFDKQSGLVIGRTDNNVDLTIQLNRDGSLSVNGRLVGQRVLINTTVEKEVDRVVAALRPNLK